MSQPERGPQVREPVWDVAICGGGLAGLTLAIQLRRSSPDLRVLVIEEVERPLPTGAFKVGESTVEIGAHYLTDIVGVKDHLDRCHLRKLGLRYFFAPTGQSFTTRPELGISRFPPVTSYQIDRGRFESHLREVAETAGVALREGIEVTGVGLGDPHEVETSAGSIRGRWLIDATGRRRLLHRKLRLTVKHPRHRFSAAWFRLDGRVDLADGVPAVDRTWHGRVDDDRYHSTNHLMGDGYWAWLIPLASDMTSVGIVTADHLHPVRGFNRPDRSTRWLEQQEPYLAELLDGRDRIDFASLHNYSYSTKQVISKDRWACVGEAALFSDPLYSPGTDVLGITNTLVAELVLRDHHNSLTASAVADADGFIRGYNEGLTHNIQAGYPFHGQDLVMACKIIWDTVCGWGITAPTVFGGLLTDEISRARAREATGAFGLLSSRMQQLFTTWASLGSRRGTFEFVDYLSLPFAVDLRQRSLRNNPGIESTIEDLTTNMFVVRALARAIFLIAVEDLWPMQVDALKSCPTLDPLRIELEPGRWSRSGLLGGRPNHAGSHVIYEELRSRFTLA